MTCLKLLCVWNGLKGSCATSCVRPFFSYSQKMQMCSPKTMTLGDSLCFPKIPLQLRTPRILCIRKIVWNCWTCHVMFEVVTCQCHVLNMFEVVKDVVFCFMTWTWNKIMFVKSLNQVHLSHDLSGSSFSTSSRVSKLKPLDLRTIRNVIEMRRIVTALRKLNPVSTPLPHAICPHLAPTIQPESIFAVWRPRLAFAGLVPWAVAMSNFQKKKMVQIQLGEKNN